VLTFSGRPEDGLAALRTCVRLDPRAPSLVYRLYQISLALYFCREHEAAAEAARQGIRSYPNRPGSYRVLTAALARAARLCRAQNASGRLRPGISRGGCPARRSGRTIGDEPAGMDHLCPRRREDRRRRRCDQHVFDAARACLGASGLRVFGRGSATSAGCAEIVGIRFRSGLLAGGRWIRTIGPRRGRFLLRKANCGTERGQPKRVVSYKVPMVRIHLPPAESPVRT
jgi:hypothetical protein